MGSEVFSTSEALRFGWDTFKRNIGLSVGLAAASLGAMLIVNGLAQATERYSLLALGFSLSSQLVQAFTAFVWLRFGLAIHDGHEVRAREIVPSGATVLNYIAVWFLYALLVSAGLILLVIPGIYLAVRYGLVGFLVADRRTDVLGAFRESSELTRGMRWRLFAFGLVVFLMNLAGAAFFGVGLLVTLPVGVFASVMVYRRLAERSVHEPPPVSSPWPLPT